MASDLDTSILSVLPNDTAERDWLTTAEVVDALEHKGISAPLTDAVQHRLTLLMAQGAVRCRDAATAPGAASHGGLAWRRAQASARLWTEGSLWMSEDEALALQALRRFCGRQITALLTTSLQAVFEAADMRLRQGPGNESQVAWHRKIVLVDAAFPLLPLRPREAVFHAVSDAVFAERQLDIVYRPRNAPERRLTVKPLGLVEKASQVYLVAIEGGTPDIASIRLDRIASATIRPERFDYPPDFCLADHVAQCCEFDLLSEGDIKLAVRFHREYGVQVRECALSADQTEEIRPDGSVTVHCTVELNERLRQWLRSFGSGVEVLEPIGLRREMAADARMAAKQYCRR
ncbi:WYL domain-containing protein [Cupriavidus respiraculi]|uniref:helix-turn-helix transcriptional regulator n=1 Tax=Cupriavidus respiraculi TaxID=195930 RepID=UPI001C9392D1|nr:WYL domain-containing protein [Cupriavidus respiraculi]MBY4945968.1 WYL domain-containing protein [Cupriavidus respiraculi]